MFRVSLPLVALMTVSQLAGAATVNVRVRGADGQPLPDAVVQLEPAQPLAAVTPKPPGPFVMRQQDISFQPHVLIVPVGTAVSFPNMDKVRHHVYSFSRAKTFQLKLYGREEARTVTFDRPGIVPVGCNIHDRMSGFIVVVATPFAGKTDASGRVSLTGVPAGGATLRLWSPAVRAPGNEIAEPVNVPAAGLDKTFAVGG